MEENIQSKNRQGGERTNEVRKRKNEVKKIVKETVYMLESKRVQERIYKAKKKQGGERTNEARKLENKVKNIVKEKLTRQ